MVPGAQYNIYQGWWIKPQHEYLYEWSPITMLHNIYTLNDSFHTYHTYSCELRNEEPAGKFADSDAFLWENFACLSGNETVIDAFLLFPRDVAENGTDYIHWILYLDDQITLNRMTTYGARAGVAWALAPAVSVDYRKGVRGQNLSILAGMTVGDTSIPVQSGVHVIVVTMDR